MSNDFFNASGAPAQGGQLVSPNMRAEFAAIAAGFDKLPTLTGNAYEVTYINASGSAMASVGGDGLLKMSTTGIPTIATAGTDYINTTTIVASSDAVPNDTDVLPVVDDTTAKKLSLTNLKAFIKTYFDTLYRLVTDDVTLAAGKAVIFEGTTDDTFETTLSAGDPTADRALVLPDKSGTLAVTADITFDASAVTGIGNGRATDITISSAGEVTMPLQPAFLAYNSATDSNVTGDSTSYTVVCDTEIFDQNGDYNNGTGVFTAPVTGRYRLTARALVSELASAHVIQEINLITSNRSYNVQDIFGSNPLTQRQLEINVLADMDAGDTASFAVVIRSGTKVCDVYGSATGNFTLFAGELVA